MIDYRCHGHLELNSSLPLLPPLLLDVPVAGGETNSRGNKSVPVSVGLPLHWLAFANFPFPFLPVPLLVSSWRIGGFPSRAPVKNRCKTSFPRPPSNCIISVTTLESHSTAMATSLNAGDVVRSQTISTHLDNSQREGTLSLSSFYDKIEIRTKDRRSRNPLGSCSSANEKDYIENKNEWTRQILQFTDLLARLTKQYSTQRIKFIFYFLYTMARRLSARD